MHATLLLNASYEPLRIISWKKALTLFFAGKVEVIEEHDREIHAITFAIKLPSIIRQPQQGPSIALCYSGAFHGRVSSRISSTNPRSSRS